MNCVQISLILATSCLMLVSANTGTYDYAYSVNDPITGDLKDHHETKVCNDQVYDENVVRTAHISREPIIPVSKNFVSEAIIPTASSAPIINTEYVSATPSSILRTADFESSRILAATPILETKVEAEPLLYAPLPKYAARAEYVPLTVTAAPMLESKIAAEPLLYAPRPAEYAPLPKYAGAVTVTAAPILESKIAAEPLLYAPRPAEYAPLPKYAPLLKYVARSEYYAASPVPLVASKLQTPIVQYQAAPVKIIKSAKSYGHQSTSFSHRSFVNHPPTPVKIAAVAPQYYAAAPAAPEFYAPAPAAPEYYAPAPKAPEYYAPAPKAPEYYAPALTAPEYYLAAPKSQELQNSATIAAAWQTRLDTTQAQIAHPLQQATRALYAAPAQYAYRSLSGPATSYQYANHWNNRDQSAAGLQSRYSVSSPQQYSAVYQPQYDSASQSQNSGQYDAAQEQPCEK